MAVIDLAGRDIAALVHKKCNDSYYEALLGALQKEAERLGYAFVRGERASVLPPFVEERLGLMLLLQREHYLSPLRAVAETLCVVQNEQHDGYGVCWWKNIQQALDELGVSIQAGPDAAEKTRAAMPQVGHWDRAAADLLQAIRLHLQFMCPDVVDDAARREMSLGFLMGDGFDSLAQMFEFLINVPGGGEAHGWVDGMGRRTDLCPDIASLLERVRFAGRGEQGGVVTLALAQLRAMQSAGEAAPA